MWWISRGLTSSMHHVRQHTVRDTWRQKANRRAAVARLAANSAALCHVRSGLAMRMLGKKDSRVLSAGASSVSTVLLHAHPQEGMAQCP